MSKTSKVGQEPFWSGSIGTTGPASCTRDRYIDLKMSKRRSDCNRNGIRRRSSNFFKVGHKLALTPQNEPSEDSAPHPGWVRSTPEEFSLLVRDQNGRYTNPDADGALGEAKFLRPKAVPDNPDNVDVDEEDINMVISKKSLLEMVNSLLRTHVCPNPGVYISKTVKKGLGSRVTIECRNCLMVPSTYKLYTEIERSGRGAKSAAINTALQVGLNESAIGNSKARLILAVANIAPPARSNMQTTSSSVGDKIKVLNDSNMAEIRADLIEINKKRGIVPEKCNKINVSVDARYNSIHFGCRGRPGQAATQAVMFCTEDVTDKHKIIASVLQNKLCVRCTRHKTDGLHGKHLGFCSANLDFNDTLSEKAMGATIGRTLAISGLFVQHATTDSDGTSAKGMLEGMQEIKPDCSIQRQCDTVHLGESQFRAGLRAEFSDELFPGRTVAIRTKVKQAFMVDVKHRCHQVLTELRNLFDGDTEKMGTVLPKTVDTIMKCYGGDHTSCRRQTVLCRAGKKYCWFNRSAELRAVPIRSGDLNFDDQDKHFLRQIIEMRLSVPALNMTRLNNTTNKCESSNRALSARLPKNVTFARNAGARVASTVHSLNNGLKDSLVKKMDHVKLPPLSTVCKRHLEMFENDNNYHATYQNSRKFKVRQQATRLRRSSEYYRKTLTDVDEDDEYSKDKLLENELDLKRPTKDGQKRRAHIDHTYATPPPTEVDHTYSSPPPKTSTDGSNADSACKTSRLIPKPR